jgi:hypothetical protein
MPITLRSDCGFSFAGLSAANEKMIPLRSLRLCGENIKFILLQFRNQM